MAPMTVDQILDGIIARESKAFTDDPDDSGGPTRYGITARTLGAWRKLGRNATRAEVQQLTESEARSIYRAQYVRPFDTIPFPEIQVQCIDWGVTSPHVLVIKALQHVLGVDEDGVIGPQTRAALAAMPWKLTNGALVAERCKFYSDLAERRPKDRKFIRGWVKRAVSFCV